MASSNAVIENQIKGLFTELWVEFNDVEIKQGMGPCPGVGYGREPHHRRQGKRASYREIEALLLLDDQTARVCETSLVPYWPQLCRCLLFRARTQAYLEKG